MLVGNLYEIKIFVEKVSDTNKFVIASFWIFCG